MEMHQLRYFLAVAQSGSFTAAARVCHVSQPSLSAQIAKLETELGGSLFERSRTGARLTSRGALFRPHAAESLQRLEIGKKQLDELSGLRRGTVSFGCLPTTGAFLLPPLLLAFGRRHPEIQVQLQEGSSPVLAQALRNFEVELAILDEAGMGPDIAGRRLFSEPLLLAVPPSHRLASRDSVSLDALADEPLILMRRGHGFHTIVVDVLARAGVKPTVVYESSEIDTVQALVRAGFGLSLVPRMVMKSEGIAYVNIEPPTPSRTLLIAHRRGAVLDPAANALYDTTIEILGTGT